MKKFFIKRTGNFILSLLVAASIILQSPCISQGAQVRPGAADIPSSTLIIGTHLIHIKAINSEVLEIASKSAQNSMQENIYYKSEFAGGSWFDISNASGFSEISSEGKPVKNSVIDALVLTHWTKEDGKTIDLSTGNAVDIHKIDDPTNFSTLPELAELKTRRDMLIETLKNEDTNENRQKLESIKRILEVPFNSRETGDATKKLDEIEKYILYLKEKDAREDWVNSVVALKGDISTEKSLMCYQEVVSRLNNEISFAESRIKDDDNKKVAATDLSAAYYTCLDSVNKKIAELENSRSGSQTLGALEKEGLKYKDAFISSAQNADYTAADANLEKYMSVGNILGGLKINIPMELSILRPLLPDVSRQLSSLCEAGISPEYTEARKAGEPDAVLASLKKEYLSAVSFLSSDIEAIVGYIKERDTDTAKLEADISPVITNCIDAISKTPDSDAKEGIIEIMKQLANSMNSELSVLKEPSSELSNKLKALDGEISRLTTDYLTALDNRDLSTAQGIKAEIDDISKQKADIYENAAMEQGKLLNEKANIESRLEAALAQGDSALAGELLNELSAVNASLEVQGAATDGLTSSGNTAAADLLGEMGQLLDQNDTASALARLQEISDILDTYPSASGISLPLLREMLPKVQAKLSEAEKTGNIDAASNLKDMQSLMESLTGTTADDGTRADSGTDNLQASLLSKIDSLMIKSGVSANSAEGQLLKLLILERLKKLPEFSGLEERIKGMQDDSLALMDSLGSNYTVDDFQFLNGDSYGSLKELASITGRRYVRQQNSGTASIVKGRSAMVFEIDSTTVTINKKAQNMPSPALVSGNMTYVPLSFVVTQLDYSWLPAGKNGKPLVYPHSLDEIVANLFK